jgi:kinesin family protein 2/24
MKGVQEEAIKDIFKLGSSKHKDLNVNYFVSYFEIYRAGVYDLLNDKEKLEVMEDYNNEIQIQGLQEVQVSDVDQLQE